jgi:hypothetical protein
MKLSGILGLFLFLASCSSAPVAPPTLPPLAAAVILGEDVVEPAHATVRVSNYSGNHFKGWKRVNVDELDIPVGDWIVGGRTSLDTRAVDFYLDLPSGQQRTIVLTQGTPRAPPRLPRQPLAYLGGLPSIEGQLMEIQKLEIDGAAIVSHWRARSGLMFVLDLHLTWHPDQPWMTGELIVTCSNPSVSNLTEVAPVMPITFGDGLILHRGGGGIVSDLGGEYADGQAHIYPIVVGWLRHMKLQGVKESFGAVANLGIGAVGIRRLLHDGNPGYAENFNARQWAGSKFSESLRRLRTWEVGTMGVAPQSGTTGAQEDQVFVRGEPLLDGGVGAEWPVYLSALKMANRPGHFLNADGSPWDIATHTGPRAIMWDGRFHWHTGVSPYQHGKDRHPTSEETHGWSGFDVEHALFNTLAAGSRYTGSAGCQYLLNQVARTYMAMYTLTPGWSNTQPFASRATGWEGIMAVHLWRELKDRQLAQRVKDHWNQRVLTVIIPAREGKTWWDTRVGDQRVWDAAMQGQSGPWETWAWAIPWQQSIGAYGLELGCRVLGPAAGIPVALAAAKVCVDRDWVQLPGETRWRNVGNQPALLADRDLSFYTAEFLDSRPTWFTTTWGVPAAEVVQRYEPDNARAAAIWQQALDLTADGRQSWIPPGYR